MNKWPLKAMSYFQKQITIHFHKKLYLKWVIGMGNCFEGVFLSSESLSFLETVANNPKRTLLDKYLITINQLVLPCDMLWL